jgi:hypothetical protein
MDTGLLVAVIGVPTAVILAAGNLISSNRQLKAAALTATKQAETNTKILTGPPDDPKENGLVGDMAAMWQELHAQRAAAERCEQSEKELRAENAHLRAEIAGVKGRHDAVVDILAKGLPQLVLPAEAEPTEEIEGAVPARRPRRR